MPFLKTPGLLLLPGLLLWFVATLAASVWLELPAARVVALAGFVLNLPLVLWRARRIWRAGRRVSTVLSLFTFAAFCLPMSVPFFAHVPQVALYLETALLVLCALCVFACLLLILAERPQK